MKNGERAALLPLTLGLLASAMQRRDHAAFLTPELRFWPGRAWRADMVRDMDRIMAMWDAAKRGELRDAQILEEFEGAGFYRTDREDHYSGLFAGFAGMQEIAISRLQAFRGRYEGEA